MSSFGQDHQQEGQPNSHEELPMFLSPSMVGPATFDTSSFLSSPSTSSIWPSSHGASSNIEDPSSASYYYGGMFSFLFGVATRGRSTGHSQPAAHLTSPYASSTAGQIPTLDDFSALLGIGHGIPAAVDDSTPTQHMPYYQPTANSGPEAMHLMDRSFQQQPQAQQGQGFFPPSQHLTSFQFPPRQQQPETFAAPQPQATISMAQITGAPSRMETKRDSIASASSEFSLSSMSNGSSSAFSVGMGMGGAMGYAHMIGKMSDEQLLEAALATEDFQGHSHNHHGSLHIHHPISASSSGAGAHRFLAVPAVDTKNLMHHPHHGHSLSLGSATTASPSPTSTSFSGHSHSTSVSSLMTSSSSSGGSSSGFTSKAPSQVSTSTTTASTPRPAVQQPQVIPRAFMRPNAVRASQACVACRKRKVRCVPLASDHPLYGTNGILPASSSHSHAGTGRNGNRRPPTAGGTGLPGRGKCCVRCAKIGIECVWAEERRGKKSISTSIGSTASMSAAINTPAPAAPAFGVNASDRSRFGSIGSNTSSDAESSSSHSSTPRQSLTSNTSTVIGMNPSSGPSMSTRSAGHPYSMPYTPGSIGLSAGMPYAMGQYAADKQ